MCGQPPKGVVGSPPGSAPRRRVGRVGRGSHGCAGTACARLVAPDALGSSASLLERQAGQTPHGISSGALYEPSVPRPPGTARAFVRARSLASFAAPSRCARVGTRRQSSRSPRDGHKQSGGGRPSLRGAGLRRLDAARHVSGGCPSTGAQSLAPRIRAPPRPFVDAGAQLTSRDSGRQARANPCRHRRAARVEDADTVNKPWAGSSARP